MIYYYMRILLLIYLNHKKLWKKTFRITYDIIKIIKKIDEKKV